MNFGHFFWKCWKCKILIRVQEKQKQNIIISGGRPPLIFLLPGRVSPFPRFRRPWRRVWSDVLWSQSFLCSAIRGAPRGGSGGPTPFRPKNTRFWGFLPLNYVICNLADCVLKVFAMWDDRGSLQQGNEITYGWFFAPYWPLYVHICKFLPPPPLEKILGAPLTTGNHG